MSPNYDREKRSWSEIDKKKDSGSRYNKRDPDQHQKRASERVKHKYREALDGLFTPGQKLTKDQQKAVQKLREIAEREEFIAAATAYVGEHGLPHAWEDLECFLRHTDVKILRDTIERMEALLAEQSETRKSNFAKDLSLIQMTTRDKDLRLQVGAVLKTLQPA